MIFDEIRDMQADEYPLLENFLYEAVFQKDERSPVPRNILKHPALRAYVEDFGSRKGDLCLCAVMNGIVIGAVWTRLMRGFGHADDRIPELAMAVHTPFRRQGTGTALITAMLRRLEREGFHAVSLSVQKQNPAYALYSAMGFTVLHEHDEDCIMLRSLRHEGNI